MNGLALCSGYGGFDLGLSLILRGYRTVCHVERESYVASILAARMDNGTLHQAPIWDDLVTFGGKPWRGIVDIVTAGFPCQPWSTAGNKRGVADERWLWPHIARIVREVGPLLVFLENAPGLLAGGLDPILGSLATLGYDAEWGMFRASDVGATHIRKRVFILAYCNKDGLALLGECRPFDSEWPPFGNDTDRQDAAMEHTHCDSRGSRDLPEPVRAADAGTEDRGPFPPYPDDRDGWSAAPPETQPAICGVADGPADWMDGVRACGNGVVPAVVGLAFYELAHRALEKRLQ